MIKIYSPPSGHASAVKRIGKELEEGYNIISTSTPDDANVIITALMEELDPFISHFGGKKGYLIWCDEPLWSNIFKTFQTRSLELVRDDAKILVEIMNCFTGDIHLCNSHFLQEQYLLSKNFITKRVETLRSMEKTPNTRKIISIMTRRFDNRWVYKTESGVFSLNQLRNEIAELGLLHGVLVPFGDGWPNKTPSSIRDHDDNILWSDKIELLQQFDFNLCFENTYSRYYVTEKIWHSIIAGSLPIYYAGPSHTIYQDFPEGSFIDYFQFNSPYQLFEYVTSMSSKEYQDRLKLCFTSLERLVNLDDGKRALQLQVFSTASRIQGIFDKLLYCDDKMQME